MPRRAAPKGPKALRPPKGWKCERTRTIHPRNEPGKQLRSLSDARAAPGFDQQFDVLAPNGEPRGGCLKSFPNCRIGGFGERDMPEEGFDGIAGMAVDSGAIVQRRCSGPRRLKMNFGPRGSVRSSNRPA